MIAVALSPKARALIVAHRDAHRPTAADRERVTAALRARLGASVLPLDTLPATTPVRPASTRWLSGGAQRLSATALGVCVVGSALFLAQRPAATPHTATPGRNESAAAVIAAPVTPVSSAPALTETPITPRLEPVPAPRPAQHARPKPAVSRSSDDTLGQEVKLLSNATSQLSAGQASSALLALEEHQRRFSHGRLSDERNLAKARALCMLHRFEEGRATLALLATGTPSAARVKEECDAAWARANAAAARKAE